MKQEFDLSRTDHLQVAALPSTVYVESFSTRCTQALISTPYTG
jgi:hypothetical protein